MIKTLRLLVSSLALATVAGSSALGAEAIVKLASTQTIKLGSQSSFETVPVVSSVALDPTGQLMATAGDDHVVRILNVRTGQTLRRLVAHADWVQSVAFSPDGRILATAGKDRRILLWSTNADQPYRQLADDVRGISTLAFSPDGRFLAAAGFEPRIWLYEGTTGQLVRMLDAPGADIRTAVFSPDGRQLAAAGREGRIRIWQVANGSELGDLDAGDRRRIHALAFSADGRQLAAGGEASSIRLWDTQHRTFDILPSRPGKVMSLAFCGPETLAAGGSDDIIRIWNLATHSEQYQLVGHTGTVSALTWDAQTALLLSGSFDTTVRTWQMNHKDVETISQR